MKNNTKKYHKDQYEDKLSSKQKKDIEFAVEKAMKDYGKTIRMLGNA